MRDCSRRLIDPDQAALHGSGIAFARTSLSGLGGEFVEWGDVADAGSNAPCFTQAAFAPLSLLARAQSLVRSAADEHWKRAVRQHPNSLAAKQQPAQTAASV